MYRGFILGSVKREFQTRYSNSVLGVIWTVLNPLATILIYTLIFSQIMKARLPGVDNNLAYSIYLCSGIVTWGLFAEILSKSQTVFIANANMIKKLSFPRICLPIIVVLNALVNFAIIFAIFLCFLLVTGNFPGWELATFFPVLLVQVLLAIGLGISVGVLNVFFRDVGQFFTIVLQFWFWFTPIVYPLSILSESIARFVRLNPMTNIVEAYHGIFVTGETPQWSGLLPIAIVAILLCVLGMRLFRKHSGEMVDLL
ncbi:MAG: ABC transporter permease [bacterium]